MTVWFLWIKKRLKIQTANLYVRLCFALKQYFSHFTDLECHSILKQMLQSYINHTTQVTSKQRESTAFPFSHKCSVSAVRVQCDLTHVNPWSLFYLNIHLNVEKNGTFKGLKHNIFIKKCLFQVRIRKSTNLINVTPKYFLKASFQKIHQNRTVSGLWGKMISKENRAIQPTIWQFLSVKSLVFFF